MEKDSSIRNQKVFVRMESVLELQRKYLEAVAEWKRVRDNPEAREATRTYSVSQKAAFEQVINILELPIPKQQGL